MTTFDSCQIPLPLNPGLSHPSICTPNLLISHHHKHHTWRLLHTLLHLHSNQQGQTRRLLPHVSFKTLYAKTPHPLNHFKLHKLMTPRRDDHRPSTTSMKTITTTTTTMVAQARRLQQRLKIHGGERRLAARAPSETCELGLRKARKKLDGKTSKTPPILEQVKRVGPGLTARGMRFLFHSDIARMMLTLHRDLHHAHADTNTSKHHPRRYRRFYFFGTSLQQKRGAGQGRVGARSSSSKNPQQHLQQRARETR